MIRLSVFLVAVSVSLPLLANDGRILHNTACIQCHAALTGGNASDIYTRANHTVIDLNGLNKQVKRCTIAADVSWSKAQQNAVIQYLSQQVYDLN